MLEWMFAYIQVQDSCKISYVLQEFLVQAKFLQEAYHIITNFSFKNLYLESIDVVVDPSEGHGHVQEAVVAGGVVVPCAEEAQCTKPVDNLIFNLV